MSEGLSFWAISTVSAMATVLTEITATVPANWFRDHKDEPPPELYGKVCCLSSRRFEQIVFVMSVIGTAGEPEGVR